MDSELVVNLTSSASLRGIRQLARESSCAVAGFLGVPYAQAPIGPLRFAPTKSIELWSGERTVSKFGPLCPQNLEACRETYAPVYIDDNMSEDCLYLNIWTPSLDVTAKLPVMVWIHGGAYVQGCSNYYDGTAMAAHQNIVYVSINYRVGIYGFLCMNEERISGNMGLYDQIEALKWVQKYISKFGGDPNNVTVFGESAGAMCIGALLVSPLVIGSKLFRRAILQSGTFLHATQAWTAERARSYALHCAGKLGGVNIQSAQDLIKFLEGKSPSEVTAMLGMGCPPVIDGKLVVDDSPKPYLTGRVEKVDIIVGFNRNEGEQFVRDFVGSKKSEFTSKRAREFLTVEIMKRRYKHQEKVKAIVSLAYDAYLKGVTDPLKLRERLSDFMGDVLFSAPTVQQALLHCVHAKVYMYLFDHRPSFSRYPDYVTADHGNEIPFVHGEPFLTRLPDVWGRDEKSLSTCMMTYWANFARTGNPNRTGLKAWPEYSAANRVHLRIRKNPTVEKDYEPERMNLWLNTVQRLVNESTSAAKL